MSVNAALQQAASGCANVIAGLFVTSDPATGRLLGYPTLGYVSVGFFLLTVTCAYALRSAAPYVSIPEKKAAAPLPPVEAAV
jgi:hypothetical protein